MATSGKDEPVGFPPLSWEEDEPATRPMPLHELPRQVGIDNAMAIIARRHEHIAKAITVFWGTKDCVEYIELSCTRPLHDLFIHIEGMTPDEYRDG